MIRISVLSGPDTGLSRTFPASPVRIGRGIFNELQLNDPLVSQRHGEIVLVEGRWVYRDLGSRHGSEIRDPSGRPAKYLQSRTVPQEESLALPGQLVLGGTRLLCEPSAPSAVEDTMEGVHVARSVHETLEQFSRRIHLRDPRIGSLLEVSQTLHEASTVDEVVERIADAVFTAFPSARRVAMCAPSREGSPAELRPVRVIPRPGVAEAAAGAESGLSRSVLRRVFQRQQAVLHFRDEMGDPNDSLLEAGITALMAAPLVGTTTALGVLLVDASAREAVFRADDLDVFAAMASYAAFALERLRLQGNLYEMFEAVVRMSVKAIDARDPATAGHSERVARASVLLARAVSESASPRWANTRFGRDELLELRYASLLHDFGKVAVRERVLTKGTRVDPTRVEMVRARVAAAEAQAVAEAWRDVAASDESGGAEERVARSVEPLRRTLREGWDAFVRNQMGRTIPDEDRTTLRELAAQTWVTQDGRVEPVMPADVVEEMKIPRGTLTPDEWAEMRTHVTHSWEFASQIPWSPALARVPQIARGHHERLDGSGYPDALDARDLPLQVRILSIADMFDAMTAFDRSYRKAVSTDDALAILRRDAEAGLLDSDLVTLFIEQVVPRLDRWGTRETHTNSL